MFHQLYLEQNLSRRYTCEVDSGRFLLTRPIRGNQDENEHDCGQSAFEYRWVKLSTGRLTCVVKEDNNEIKDKDRVSIVKEATRERSVRVSFD
jgi:hypothetical protein